MRYSILDFKQEALLELQANNPWIDTNNLVILETISHYACRNRIENHVIDHVLWFEIPTKQIEEDLPFLVSLGIDFDTIIADFVSIELLNKIELNGKTFYSLSGQYEELKY